MNKVLLLALTVGLLALLTANGVAVSAAQESSVILGANASTNGPRVNYLIYEEFLNTHSAYLAVKEGQANILDNVLDPADISDALSSPNLNVNSTVSYEFGYLAFNTQRWPTSDVHFRRAIAYLMNYSAIQTQILQGNEGLASQSFLPSQLYGGYNDPNVPTYDENLQAAVGQLQQVSNLTHSNGQWIVRSTGQPLSVQLYTRAEFPQWQQVAKMIQQNAAMINLTINVQVITHATAVGVLSSHNYYMYTGGSIAGNTPNWLYYTFYDYHVIGGISNFMLFDNSTLNNYLYTLETSNNLSVIRDAAYQAQYVLAQQLPMIPWYYAAWIIPSLKSGWSGYVFQPGFSTWKEGEHVVQWTVLNVHETNSSTGGTFRVALISPPDSLNPISSFFNYDTDVLNSIFDPALAIAPGNATKLIPWLVSSYSVTPFSGTTPHGHTVVNGQTITLNFVHNATFQDNTPLTALDYNFSIWYEAYAGARGPYASNAAFSPVAGELPGLVDSQVNPSDIYQVTLYLNDTSAWDIYVAGNVWVLPMHIWESVPLSQVQSYDPASHGTLIGSGPFVFQSWIKGGPITLTRNPGYFRTPWWLYVTQISPSSNTFSTNITQGQIPITNATAYLYVESGNSVVEKVPLTTAGNGVYTGSVSTASLTPNHLYEAIVNATYTAGGINHEALRFSAIQVSSTASTTSSVTQPKSSMTTNIVIAVVVVIIIVAAAVLLLRRR
jgi:ABC-type transport system substrate-binding protein